MTSISSKEDHQILWSEQKDCLIELLRSRVALRALLQKKMYNDRVAVGNLSASEILSMLEGQNEDDDTDFITQITEQKRTLMSETRKMREQEKQVEQTERKIALFIKNAGQVSALQHKPPKKKKGAEDQVAEEKMTEETLTLYSNLFYLLQTEPKYLAKIIDLLEARYKPVTINAMIETILLTLYGDAFSPREEHLLLTVFRLTIESSFASITKLDSFVELQTIGPMVLTYAKRKQGIECIQNTLGQIICDTIKENLSYNLDAKSIHNAILNLKESETGQKFTTERSNTVKMILQDPDVRKVLDQNIENLKKKCTLFFDAIIKNVKKIPYGLRWICKQIKQNALQTFPNASTDDIDRLLANYIFYRFYSVAIATPDAFHIKTAELNQDNLNGPILITNVLYALFNCTPFSKAEKNRWMMPMNPWIEERIPLVKKYYDELIDVLEPEEFLEIDAYLDMVQAVKPVILISYGEIRKTHEILHDNINDLAKDEKDPLRIIINELGPEVKTYSAQDTKEIQLTLINKFPRSVEEGATEEAQNLFNATKSLTIRTLRMLPPNALKKDDETANFSDLLKFSLKYAKETENMQLKTNIQTIKSNLEKLEKAKLVEKTDGYRKFMKKIALEIANRAQIREQQRRELNRLKSHIETVRNKENEYTQLLATWAEYLKTCRDNQFAFKKSKNSKKKQTGKTIGPFSYSYSELLKQRVIITSDVPKIYTKAVKFVITSTIPGVFDIEVKALGKSKTMQIELDDLLDKRSKNVESFEMAVSFTEEDAATVELDVNMTIFLFNKLLAKK